MSLPEIAVRNESGMETTLAREPVLRTGAGREDHRPEERPLKRIPAELRRGRPEYRKQSTPLHNILIRLKQDSQFLRTAVQFTFALLCVWIGVEFALFVRWGTGGLPVVAPVRPPGVEGFLPISALISLKYWLQTGIVNDVHPSGLFILLAVAGLGLFLKKAFCGWLCPVGTLSESLWQFGQRILKRNLRLPRWLDIPLRGLKYVLLVFFVAAIWNMDGDAVRSFIYSPYNKVADIKMYVFFADMTAAALWTIILLVLGSVVVKNFWCRYLCPYGAFLGILSWFSPLKVTRNATTCIDCELCTKACPANIRVHALTRVRSDECTSCYACIEACPVKETLQMRLTRRSAAVPSWAFGVLVAGVFVGITGLAMLTGHWQNRISSDEYRYRMQHLDSPLYQHNRGQVPVYGPQD